MAAFVWGIAGSAYWPLHVGIIKVHSGLREYGCMGMLPQQEAWESCDSL